MSYFISIVAESRRVHNFLMMPLDLVLRQLTWIMDGKGVRTICLEQLAVGLLKVLSCFEIFIHQALHFVFIYLQYDVLVFTPGCEGPPADREPGGERAHQPPAADEQGHDPEDGPPGFELCFSPFPSSRLGGVVRCS